MNKRVLLKVFLLVALFCQLVNKAHAQYAIGGTAPNGLASKIYWLTWNTANFQKVVDGGGPGISYPSGFIDKTGTGPTPGGSILPGNYIWQYSPTVRIKATIAPFTAATGGLLQPYTPGEFFTDGLDVFFNGNGVTTKAANDGVNQSGVGGPYSRGVPFSAVANTVTGQIQFNISIRVEIFINNGWIDTPYPGMVIADAESMAAGELIQAITESSGVGAIGWQLIGFRKGDANPAPNPGYNFTTTNQENDYKVTLSTAPGSTTPASQIALTVNGVGNYNTQAVFYAHGVNALKNVTVRGAAKTALAIGFVMPFDMGDALGYTKTGAYINGFNTANNIVPANAVDKPVSTIPVTPLEPLANVYLGNNPVVDADGDNVLNATASTDDIVLPGGVVVDDEDAIVPANITNRRVNAVGDVTAAISNITNGHATLTANIYAWIDFDGNGVFNDYESAESLSIPASSSGSPTLTFLRSKFGSHIKAGTTKMRVRVTTNNLTDNLTLAGVTAQDERSESYSSNGEVEDYEVIIPGITVSGSVFHDPTGSGTGTLISSVGSPAQALKAYLVKGSVIKQKVSVSAGGTYAFSNVDNGTDYKILLSVKDVDINTATVADITTGAMPAGWVSSGDFYGLNNLLSSSQVTNVKDASADLQVSLSTPIAGQDVTVVNFSLNQKPNAVNDPAANTTAGNPITFNITGNDSDADAANGGALDLTKILLLDPGTSTYKTTFTVLSQGTYTVSTGTPGSVTFQPAAGFTGTTSPVSYTVADNGGAVSNAATFTITVKPTGATDTYNLVAGTAPTFPNAVLDNDNAGAGATIAITLGVPSGKGTATVNGTSIDYVPGTFTGTTSYQYTITSSDATQTSAPVTVNITVKPTGATDTYNLVAGTAPTFPNAVLDNDNAGAGATIAITTGVPLGKGTATVNGTSIDYVPGTFTGTTSYQYTITSADATQTSAPVTVNITVKPTGATDAVIVVKNVNKIIDVLTNDANAGIDATITEVTPPQNGTLISTDLNTGIIEYKPNPGYTGPDNFTYRVISKDGTIKSDVINVNITVTETLLVGANDVDYVASYKVDQTFGINETPTQVTTDVTTNDPDGAVATAVTDFTNGSNGITTVSGKTITYKPNANFVGTDTYKYKLTNGSGLSNEITVTIHVSGVKLEKKVTNTAVINSAGETINYEFKVKNVGPVTLSDVVVTDAGVDAGSILPSPNIASLAPNAEVTLTAKYTVKTADVIAGKYVNQATVTAKDPKIPTPNNVTSKSDNPQITNTNPYDPTEVTIIPLPASISLTKAGVLVGNNINYTFTITNTGTVNLTTVTLTDNKLGLSDAAVTVPNGALLPNASVTYNYVYTLTQADKDLGKVDNTATVAAKDPGNNTVTGNGSTTTTVPSSPSMSLSKVANNGATKAGDVINYTLIVTNTGNVTLTDISITDAGANSITPATIQSLAPGASVNNIKAEYTVQPIDVTRGKYENQATATAKDPKGNPISKKSDDPTTTSTPDDPTVVPITPAAPASINLAKTGVFSGNQVTYTFIITNNGGVPLNTITLTDAKLGLSNVTITAPSGGLLPNASLTYNATYTLKQEDKDLGAVNNTATVSAKDPSNNTVTGIGSTVTTVPTSPVAANDVAETDSDTPEIISVLTNDNPGNSTFNLTSVEVVSSPTHGTVVINTDGTVTYAPNKGYTGSDSFTYKVKDAYGYVTNVATVTITVKAVQELKIPNLFSPNGDGVNDGFVIKDLGDYAQNELIVINRWGNEVYRQADYKNNWSGTGLNEGTYFYIVRLKKSTGESWVIKKGYVTLIRNFRK